MPKLIKQGDVFTVSLERGRVDTFRREADDTAPRFECERIRVTHLTCNVLHDMKPYTFGAEPEWFRQRGIEAEEESR